MGTPVDVGRVLPALALALVELPRANLQDLARRVGISKATLYRFCRTRDVLVDKITERFILVVDDVIASIDLQAVLPLDGLRLMTAKACEHRELMLFMGNFRSRTDTIRAAEARWQAVTDAFFLRGQQTGVFRIDIPAPALSEIWSGLVQQLVDAEYRGRIARASLVTLVETAFLEGAAVRAC